MAAKKQIIPVVLLVVSLGLAAGFGWYWYSVGRHLESTDNAYVEATMSVLSARVPGVVAQVLVGDNQPVKAGDLLFVIDQAEYMASVRSAEAQLAAAKARANTLNEQLSLQQSLVAQAEADARMVDADLVRLRKDLERFQALDALNASSRQQFELVQAEEKKVVAAAESSAIRIKAQKKQVMVLRAQLAEVEAAIGQAGAMLELAQLNLEDTAVKAPFDGVVGNRHIEPGKYLQPGVPVLNVVSTREIYVTANFKETQIGRMRIGHPATLTVDAYPDQPLQGVVASLSPASGSRFSLLPPENATGNFSKIVQRIPVRIEFTDLSQLHGILRPGMSVEVEINTSDDITRDDIAMPANAAAVAR